VPLNRESPSSPTGQHDSRNETRADCPTRFLGRHHESNIRHASDGTVISVVACTIPLMAQSGARNGEWPQINIVLNCTEELKRLCGRRRKPAAPRGGPVGSRFLTAVALAEAVSRIGSPRSPARLRRSTSGSRLQFFCPAH
jgi:hypothetical protein